MNRDITDTKATPTSQLGMGSPSERRPESLGATDEAAPVSPQDRLRLRTGRTLRRWTREVRPMCSLAFPIMSGMLAHMLIGLADTIMVGRVGVVPLAASAFVNAIAHLPMIFAVGLLSAVAVLTSQAFGARRAAEAGEVLRHGLLVATGAGVLTAATSSSCPVNCTTTGDPTNNRAIGPPATTNTTANTLMTPAANPIPTKPIRRMRACCPAPHACPTRMQDAIPMPSGNMNVVAAQVMAIWCDAIALALIQPIISAAKTNALTSSRCWAATGQPRLSNRRNRSRLNAARQRAG